MYNGVKKGYRMCYSLGNGKRGEICLGKCYGKETVAEFRYLVKCLASSVRYGTRLSSGISRRVENLPLALRKILISHKLIEGTADEIIPTLSVLLEHYAKSRIGQKPDNRDKRSATYLMEYHGNKRIDCITPAEAEGIRDYLMNQRTNGRGVLQSTSVNRAITDFKSVFYKAVQWGWLKKSPYENVKGGKDTNLNRKSYVSYPEIQTVIDVCEHPELKAALAFSRFAGLRIPCEIRNLRFSDFEQLEEAESLRYQARRAHGGCRCSMS